jgi:uncharacterized protein (DUF2384 family)
MKSLPAHAVPGYTLDVTSDLSRLETHERLTKSSIEGFFAVIDKWRISNRQAGELLGGVPCSTVYRWKSAARTLRQDELTRISYIVEIYKALHSLLPNNLADRWITQPNDYFLFSGHPPLRYMVRGGIPGLRQVRSLLDATRSGR